MGTHEAIGCFCLHDRSEQGILQDSGRGGRSGGDPVDCLPTIRGPDGRPRQSRLETAALIAIVVVGTAVRLAFLFRPMQLDEAYTYNEYASKPVLDGLSWYTLPNNHLLNTLLIHVSTVVLGNEPWVVRLAALAAGLGLIPATYALTRRLCGPPEALLAAALVAASEPLIDYSTNARGYTLVALVTVLLAVTAERILADGRGGRAWDWVWFTILPAVGCFAIPIMLYPYGGIVLWLVLGGAGLGEADVRGGSGSIAWCFPGSSRRC